MKIVVFLILTPGVAFLGLFIALIVRSMMMAQKIRKSGRIDMAEVVTDTLRFLHDWGLIAVIASVATLWGCYYLV